MDGAYRVLKTSAPKCASLNGDLSPFLNENNEYFSSIRLNNNFILVWANKKWCLSHFPTKPFNNYTIAFSNSTATISYNYNHPCEMKRDEIINKYFKSDLKL